MHVELSSKLLKRGIEKNNGRKKVIRCGCFNESGRFMQLEWGTIRMANYTYWSQTKATKLKSLWTILAGLTTWQIWKHYCHTIPSGEVIMELWDHLIAFLRGSYEDIQGKIDSTSKARTTFILKWKRKERRAVTAWTIMKMKWV